MIIGFSKDGICPPKSPEIHKKRSSARKWFSEGRKWENLPKRKRTGVRNLRREENCALLQLMVAQSLTLPGLVSVNFLMNIGGEADLNEFDDIAQPCSSSFTELFMEKEKMRVSLRLRVP